MSFIDNLRMRGIFNGGDNTSFGPPNMNDGGNINPYDILSTIASLRENSKNNDMRRQQDMINFTHTLQGRDQMEAQAQKTAHHPFWQLQSNDGTNSGQSNQSMNTVFKDDSPTPYQKGLLENDKAKTDIARQSLGEKTTNDTTKNTIARDNMNIKDANTDADRSIKQQRANTYQFNATHKNAQVLSPKGGNYQLYDPITKEMHDSGISTGTMTQSDFEDKVVNGREAVATIQGDTSRDVQNERNTGNLADIAARSAGAKDLAGYKSTLTTRPQNPTQDRTANWNNAQKVINTRPDLSPFVTLGTNGQFSIQEPYTNVFGNPKGPTAAQTKELNDLIYGSSTDTKSNTKPDTKNTTTSTTKPAPSKWQVSIGDK